MRIIPVWLTDGELDLLRGPLGGGWGWTWKRR